MSNWTIKRLNNFEPSLEIYFIIVVNKINVRTELCIADKKTVARDTREWFLLFKILFITIRLSVKIIHIQKRIGLFNLGIVLYSAARRSLISVTFIKLFFGTNVIQLARVRA